MAQYNKVTPELIEKFKEISGSMVTAGGDINPDYYRDEMPIYGSRAPEVAIDVTSTEEIAAIMKLCYENNIPVTTRGAGTGLVGGCTPIAGGVVLCTMRMKKILSYDLDNFTVTVQPGVLLNDLAEDALKQGYLYPPDPGEKFATLGGNVSTNAGGMRAVKYGATRDYVRAMTVVLPTGEITHFGASVSKTSSGYSMTNLMIGSEGTLGIITEMTLKLIPAPQATVSLVIPFADLDTCIATVPKILQSRLKPQALEFMEKDIVIASETYLGKAVFPRELEGQPVGAYILCTFDGDTREELDPIIEKAAEVVLEAGAMDILVADSPAKIKDAWAARSSFLEAIENSYKLLDENDVVVPVTKIAEFLKFVNSTESEVGVTVRSFGHAGDGNLHIYALSNDLEEEEFKKRAKVFMGKVYDKAIELGGQLSGEHGIGHGKVEFFAKAVGPVNIRLMQGIKQVFDPKLILNPGKVCYKL